MTIIATHKIFIIETPLSDGSPVYAVGVFDADGDGRGVTFDAIDYRHAIAMANAIKLTADTNTLSHVEIVDRTLAKHFDSGDIVPDRRELSGSFLQRPHT